MDETVQRERSIYTDLKCVFATEVDERSIRNEISMVKQEVKLWDRTLQDTSQINTTAIYSRSFESHKATENSRLHSSTKWRKEREKYANKRLPQQNWTQCMKEVSNNLLSYGSD
jgi:hypothetical protein